MAGKSVIPLLAKRFLLSQQAEGFPSFVAWVSVTGVALGVLALTVVTSVVNGFEGELTRVITGTNGEVILYSRGDPVHEPDAIIARVKRTVPELQAISASFVSQLMISGPHGVAGAAMEGIDPVTIGFVTEIPQRISEGKIFSEYRPALTGRPPREVLSHLENRAADLAKEPQPRMEIVVGSALAERIGAKVGTDVQLIIPFAGESGPDEEKPLEESQPRVMAATVSGIAHLGMYQYDSKMIFAPLEGVQKFLDRTDQVTTFRLRMHPGTNTREIADRLTENFGYPFRARDWSSLNKNLFSAIQHEKIVIAIILTAIVIVAAFNVVSTLMMLIHDKTKELSILKAMGLPASAGFKLFSMIGLGIGAVGTGLGVLLGLGMNEVLEKTHWIDLPPEVYYIGFLPVVVRWSEVLLIVGVTMGIIFIATLYPAIRVARRSPLDGIRYE